MMVEEQSLFSRLSKSYKTVAVKATRSFVSLQLTIFVAYFISDVVLQLITRAHIIPGANFAAIPGDRLSLLMEHKAQLYLYVALLFALVICYLLLPRLLVYSTLSSLDYLPLPSLLFDGNHRFAYDIDLKNARSWASAFSSQKPGSFGNQVLLVALTLPSLYHYWYKAAVGFTNRQKVNYFLFYTAFYGIFLALWLVSGTLVSVFEIKFTVFLAFVLTFMTSIYSVSLTYSAILVRTEIASICKYMTDRWPWEKEPAEDTAVSL